MIAEEASWLMCGLYNAIADDETLPEMDYIFIEVILDKTLLS